MHVTAQKSDEFFSIKIVEVIAPPTENDLEWLVCEVEWRRLDQEFKAVSECLTSSEWQEFLSWIKSLETDPRDSVLSFCEPSLHCVYLAASDVVVFVCWLELTPGGQDRQSVALSFRRSSIKMQK
ncbi:MAG: hypothetical protein IOC63_22415 [Methylobacterium sp.]|nr:hypothetical protein [Methylobacterium sp.]